jgi:predicted dehydrogenase
MRKEWGLGIIGAGAFTEFSLEAYKEFLPNIRLHAITDKDIRLAHVLAEKFSIGSVYSSNEEIFNDKGVDIILVLTPPFTHYEIAQQALRHKKHLLVEKPIAFKERHAKKLIDLAEKKNLNLTANLVLRHHPFHQKIHEIVRKEIYGKLQQITTTALLAEYPKDHWYWKPEISGGFFLNTYCHFLDLYSFIFGSYPTSLYHIGTVENGQVIVSDYRDRTASLHINLHASNEQEYVETFYVFDNAIIETKGWMPHEMTITERSGKKQTQKNTEKLPIYKKILAEIMKELVLRTEDSSFIPTITHETLLQTVVQATRTQENQLR